MVTAWLTLDIRVRVRIRVKVRVRVRFSWHGWTTYLEGRVKRALNPVTKCIL